MPVSYPRLVWLGGATGAVAYIFGMAMLGTAHLRAARPAHTAEGTPAVGTT